MVGSQHALRPNMFAVSHCVSQSVESIAIQEDACEAHTHTLEVLYQWQQLQGALKHVAALERTHGRDE